MAGLVEEVEVELFFHCGWMRLLSAAAGAAGGGARRHVKDFALQCAALVAAAVGCLFVQRND